VRREIFIDDFRGHDDRPRRGRREYYGQRDNFHNRQDRGRGIHVLGGRRDGVGPHFEEGCNTVQNDYPNRKAYRNRYYQDSETSTTKMFTSKKDLVEYANKIGETGQQLNIYKIEEDLYKVVVYGPEVKEK